MHTCIYLYVHVHILLFSCWHIDIHTNAGRHMYHIDTWMEDRKNAKQEYTHLHVCCYQDIDIHTHTHTLILHTYLNVISWDCTAKVHLRVSPDLTMHVVFKSRLQAVIIVFITLQNQSKQTMLYMIQGYIHNFEICREVGFAHTYTHMVLRYMALRYMALRYMALRYMALRYMALRYMAFESRRE
jgi:hypothetical protein